MSKIKSISKSTFTAVNESLYSTDYVAPTYISTFLNNVNGYAHSTRKAKRDSARLLDKVASNA